jgi:riboflavin kinase / FMN adenylyltransferase
MFHGDLKVQFEGKVVKGAGRGKKLLGIPTINIATVSEPDLMYGIYCCMVELPPYMGGEYYGAMHYGPRPTFDDAVVMTEVHLLDFEGDLLGEYVRVYVFDYFRPVIAFENPDELKKYLEADIVRVRQIIGT